MSSITLDQCRSQMLAAGYDDVVERVWPPNNVLGTHSHPFEANVNRTGFRGGLLA